MYKTESSRQAIVSLLVIRTSHLSIPTDCIATPPHITFHTHHHITLHISSHSTNPSQPFQKMRLAPTLLLLPLATAAPTSPLERRQTLPVGDQIQIQSVTVAGNGCPPGTFTSQVSLDRTAVTLGFDQFAAELTPASDRDKTCAVVVQARYPVGCITAVVENTQHGFAELPAAVVGSLQAAYAVTPGRIVGSAASQTSLSGAAYVFGQPWLKTDRISTAVSATSTSRDVFMVVNFRDLLTTSGGATLASLRTDDMTIAFTDQRRSSGQW